MGPIWGPQYLWVMGGVLLLNIAFLAVFHRQLKLITFDRELATTMGLRVRLLNQAMMLLVSVTITASFYAAGAVLVVALMIVPAAVAQLVSRSLAVMFAVVSVVAVSNAVAGFWVAYWLDAATSSGLAVFYGLTFLVVQAVVLLTRRARHARVAVA